MMCMMFVSTLSVLISLGLDNDYLPTPYTRKQHHSRNSKDVVNQQNSKDKRPRDWNAEEKCAWTFFCQRLWLQDQKRQGQQQGQQSRKTVYQFQEITPMTPSLWGNSTLWSKIGNCFDWYVRFVGKWKKKTISMRCLRNKRKHHLRRGTIMYLSSTGLLWNLKVHHLLLITHVWFYLIQFLMKEWSLYKIK